MPRIYHRSDQAAANHSVYQSNAVVDNSGILKEIATNTKNINLNVDTVEVSVDALEVLQAQTNTTLASILVDTDAADSSLNTIEAQSVLTASRLNNIQNKISANVDGTGDTLGQINSNILTKNGEIESSLNSLISANHTDLIAVEASLTSMEGKIDTLDTVQDNALTKLNEIATNTANINLNVDTVEVSVDALEVLQASTNTKLDSIISKNGEIETSLNSILAKNGEIETSADALIAANHTDLIALEASLTSMEGKQDSILSKNGEIETTANAIQAAVEGTLTVASHAVTNAGTFAVQAACSGTVTANLSSTDNAVLDAIAADGDAIQGKLDTLETSANAIQSAVEGTLTVGSHAVTNAGTFAVQSTVAAALPAGTNAIGKLAANSGVDIGDVDVTSISAGTNRIGMVGLKANQAADGSGTERFVLCDAAGHLQVDVLSGGGSTDVSALSTHAKQDTIIGHLDGVEGKLDAIETTNNACQVLLGTIDADTGAIKTAVEILDNAISGNEMQVDIVSSALPSGAATQTTLASILAKNTEIETTNNANQVLLGTIDSDTDAIKTASEACATDLAALEVLSTAANTKLDTIETTLTEIAPRQATATYISAGSVANGSAVGGTIDTDDYSFMNVFCLSTTNNYTLSTQYSIDNSNWITIKSKNLVVSTAGVGNQGDILLERMPRYVRFVNYSGGTIANLTLYYHLSN